MRSLKDSRTTWYNFSSPLDSLLFCRREEEITRSHHYSAMLATLDKNTQARKPRKRTRTSNKFRYSKVNKLQRRIIKVRIFECKIHSGAYKFLHSK